MELRVIKVQSPLISTLILSLNDLICCYHLSEPGYDLSVFQGICSVLHSVDQGLLCSSCCNVETMREAAFHCYYLLQPSDNGPMLLRPLQRLSGSEEVLPVPDANRFLDSSVNKESKNSIQASLLKVAYSSGNLKPSTCLRFLFCSVLKAFT